MSCLISCVPQPRGRGTVISTCCLKAMVHGHSWKTQKLYLCQIYILCPEKQIKPQLVWKLIRFFWVCDLFACICIDLTVYIHTFLFIPTLINIPFTCTDKFGSKKKVFQSIQCTAYFLPRFIFKLLIPCFSCNLCCVLQANLFCLYNHCRRSRALCISQTRWVKYSEPCPVALLWSYQYNQNLLLSFHWTLGKSKLYGIQLHDRKTWLHSCHSPRE